VAFSFTPTRLPQHNNNYVALPQTILALVSVPRLGIENMKWPRGPLPYSDRYAGQGVDNALLEDVEVAHCD
jgi:hypothetical protein